MGDKDTLTKKMMSRPEVFADAFNYLMYEGEPVIKPEDLQELDPTAIALANAGDIPVNVQKVRDVMKEWVCKTDGKKTLMVLGVENQTNIHYAMPVRNMLYDAIQYENQVKQNGVAATPEGQPPAEDRPGEFLSHFGKYNKLNPVVTLVVYFGDKEWDAPMSMYEMFDEPDEHVLQFVSDYKINLICPRTVEPEKLEYLISDFREAMKFIQCAADKVRLREYLKSDSRFQDVKPETVRLLNELYPNRKIPVKEGATKIDMCIAIEEMMEDSKAEGKAEERQKGIFALISAMQRLNHSHEEMLNELQFQYNLTDDEAEQYMKLAEV